jgi:hypothetical protein
LRFEWQFTFSKSDASKTWLKPYVYHNIRIYEVMLAFVILSILLW